MVIKKVVNGIPISYSITKTEYGFSVLVECANQPTQTLLVSNVSHKESSIFFTLNNQLHQKTILADLHEAKKVISVHGHAPIIVTNENTKPRELQIPLAIRNIARATSLSTKSETTIKSPLAGRILKIIATPGTFVTRGKPLLIIESMKMENEICAPSDLFIKTILIAPGNMVQQNQSLIDFEKKGAEDATSKNAYECEAVENR